MSKRPFSQSSEKQQRRIVAKEMEEEDARAQFDEEMSEEEFSKLSKIPFSQLSSDQQKRFAAKEMEEEDARLEEETSEEELSSDEETCDEETSDSGDPCRKKITRENCTLFDVYTIVLAVGRSIQNILMVLRFANFISDSDLERYKAELPLNVPPSSNDVETCEADSHEEAVQQQPIEVEEEEAHAPIEDEIFEEGSSDEETFSDGETSDLDNSEESSNEEITPENCSTFDVYNEIQTHKQDIQKILHLLKLKKLISDSDFERYEAKLKFNFPLPSNDVAASENYLASLDDDGEVIQQGPIAAEEMEEEGARALIDEDMLEEETSHSTDSLLGETVDKEITPENCTVFDIYTEVVDVYHVLYKIMATVESSLAKSKKSEEDLEQPVTE